MDQDLKPPHAVAPGHWVAWRNVAFGGTNTEISSVYRLRPTGASGLGRSRVERTEVNVHELLECLNADFTILLTARAWSIDDYAMGFEAVADVRQASRDVLTRYVHAQRAALEGLQAHTTDVLLAVRLPLPDPTLIATLPPATLIEIETRVFHRVLQCFEAARVSSEELARLVSRAFRRGLPEPAADESDCCLGDDSWGAAGSSPLGGAPIDRPAEAIVLRGRSLYVESELDESHQSFLRVEAFPVAAAGRSHDLDGILARLEAVRFPVDLALSATRGGDETESRARAGETVTAARRFAADVGSRTALPITLSLAIGAPNAAELERRVVRIRRELSGIRLRRSASEQLDLFRQHLPVGGADPRAKRGGLNADQLKPFAPVRTALGSRAGPYLGHTIWGARRPVLFDPFSGHHTSVPATVLVSGAGGSGKTLCTELIMYQAFIAGAAVIDVDPNGDHALERLPDVMSRAEVLELSAISRFRGLLDPLRVASPDARERLAYEFLVSLLPAGAPDSWRQDLAMAVRSAARKGARGCSEVVVELRAGGASARTVARAIEDSVATGIAALGFARPDCPPLDPEPNRVITLRLRDLCQSPASAQAGTRSETTDRRVIIHLLAAYALHLARSQEAPQCVLGIDCASSLFGDREGQALIARIAAASRSHRFAALIGTRVVPDASWLKRHFGAALCFRAEDERQVRNIARLLEDADGRAVRLAHRLVDASPGQCLMRDYAGHVAAVQIEFVDDRLPPTLDTTPIAMRGAAALEPDD